MLVIVLLLIVMISYGGAQYFASVRSNEWLSSIDYRRTERYDESHLLCGVMGLICIMAVLLLGVAAFAVNFDLPDLARPFFQWP